MFTCNLAGFDRVVRAVIGTLLVARFLFLPESGWWLLGVFPLATAVLGYSPLYAIIGFDTCRYARHRHSGFGAPHST